MRVLGRDLAQGGGDSAARGIVMPGEVASELRHQVQAMPAVSGFAAPRPGPG